MLCLAHLPSKRICRLWTIDYTGKLQHGKDNNTVGLEGSLKRNDNSKCLHMFLFLIKTSSISSCRPTDRSTCNTVSRRGCPVTAYEHSRRTSKQSAQVRKEVG